MTAPQGLREREKADTRRALSDAALALTFGLADAQRLRAALGRWFGLPG